ncbi:MAG: slipin family protein [Desulfurococcales archaeon]|jgi:regulator of protease activity HflC (stomatin/prohibitin superfamily)|nr:slipin family protein [Desulfurococcales archaeon]
MDGATIAFIVAILFIVLPFLAASIKIVREYERAVIFRLGRLKGAAGPGIFFIIPIVDKLFKVDLRINTVDFPKQNVITKDNVSILVDAVVYYRVEDPVRAVVKVANYNYAVIQLAMTTLRDVIGTVELDELLAHREEVSKRIQKIVDEITEPWGIKIVAVTIKDVVLPEDLVRAISMQAQAERIRRARVIESEGERQAAAIIAEAAKIYANNPIAIRLRELQTLVEVAKEKNMVLIADTLRSDLSSLSYPLAAALGRTQQEQGK